MAAREAGRRCGASSIETNPDPDFRLPVYVRLAIVLFALAPVLASAAMHKCVVDGRTLYQDRPCSEDVELRGVASTIGASGVPHGATGGVSPVARQQAVRREALARGGIELIARQAFAALVGGELPTYAAYLCPKAKVALQEPLSAERFRSESRDHAARRVQLLDATGSSRVAVTFLAREAARGDMSEQRFVKASFEWLDGLPCLLGIDSWTRQRTL